jgi:hypothetical protein
MRGERGALCVYYMDAIGVYYLKRVRCPRRGVSAAHAARSTAERRVPLRLRDNIAGRGLPQAWE